MTTNPGEDAGGKKSLSMVGASLMEVSIGIPQTQIQASCVPAMSFVAIHLWVESALDRDRGIPQLLHNYM